MKLNTCTLDICIMKILKPIECHLIVFYTFAGAFTCSSRYMRIALSIILQQHVTFGRKTKQKKN